MKSYRLILAILLLVICRNMYSQVPTYTLDVKDDTLIAPNIIEFDIDLIWTNSDSISVFEFAGHKYFFDANPALGSNGGTVTMSNAGSDLPTYMQPRNPTVYTISNPWQLRWAVNTFPGAGSGFLIPPNTTVKMVRVRLQTSAMKFPEVPLQLVWRNSLPNPFTKLFAYVGTTNTDITTPSTHLNSLSNFTFEPGCKLSLKIALEGMLSNQIHRRSEYVWIYIKSATTPYTKVDSAYVKVDSLTLRTSFTSQLQPGNYYITIKHKNSLETWSKIGGTYLDTEFFFYDFTTSASQAYGNNLVFKDGLYCIYSGNINQDDIIDADDMLLIDNDLLSFAPGNSITNLNGDGIVDIDDLAICDKNARELISVQRP